MFRVLTIFRERKEYHKIYVETENGKFFWIENFHIFSTETELEPVKHLRR